MEIFCQNPLAVKASKSDGVVRDESVSQSGLDFSVNKKFLGNLSIGISRVDWKVSIPIDRFSRNFFIAAWFLNYGLVRIGLRTNYGMVLSGEAKNQSKSLMSDFGELGLFEKIFKNLKNLAGP